MADVLVLSALLITIGAVAFCIWIFWSAARAIPQPYRMRWPWLIWLLLLPVPIWILRQVLPLITLVNHGCRFGYKKWTPIRTGVGPGL